MLTSNQTNIILQNILRIVNNLSSNGSIPERISANLIVEKRITKPQIVAILKDILTLDIKTIFTNADGQKKRSVRFQKNTPEALGLKTHTVELVIAEEDFYIIFMTNSKLANGSKTEKQLSSGREKTYKPQIGIKISMNDINSFYLLEIARKRAILTSKIITDQSAQALIVRLKSIAMYLEVKLQRSMQSALISQPFLSSNFTKDIVHEALYVYDINGIHSLFELSFRRHNGILSFAKSVVNDLVLDMLNAIKVIHDLDIVHGDVKLENFILHKSANGNKLCAKLDDFGDAINYRPHLEVQSKFLQKLGFSKHSVLERDRILNIPTMLFILNLDFSVQQTEQHKEILRLHEVRNKIHLVLNSHTTLTAAQIKILSNITSILQKGTVGYASPQIVALLLKQPDNRFVNNDDFNSSYGKLQYLRFNTTVTNQARCMPNTKNDIYALGISIFGLLHGFYPTCNTITDKIIANSNFFSGILDYNEECRFNIDEAIESWRNEFSITSDHESAASQSKSYLSRQHKKMRPT